MEKENTNSGSVYVTVDGHLNPVHVSMKGTGEEGFLEFMLEDVGKALKETESILKSSFCINSFLLYIKCVSFIRRSKNSRTSRSDFLIPRPRIREITA